MERFNRYGKNGWKIIALKCAVIVAILLVILAIGEAGWHFVLPVISQMTEDFKTAKSFDEKEAGSGRGHNDIETVLPEDGELQSQEESTRVLMSVTAASGLYMRTKPSTEGDIVLLLNKGECVEVLGDPSASWLYIRCIERNNEEGYSSAKYLTLVESDDIETE